MIFGAGFGTRMGVLTRSCPKPLIEVGGTTLLDRTLSIADEAGAAPIVVNTHYLHEQMARHLSDRDVRVVHETPTILDTGGGLRNALPLLGRGPHHTLNPDCVWRGPNPLTMLAAAWDPDRMDALLLIVPLERAHGFAGKGDFDMDASGRLIRKGPFAYTGAQIIKPESLDGIPDAAFSLNLPWDRIAANGLLFGLVYGGHWCDVGHPDGIRIAEELLERRSV
jgi:MurNAc alpha-1-phosphate uridylyltransferase